MKEKFRKIAQEIVKNNKESLEEYKKSGVVEYVEILPAENSCECCKKMKGKKILLKDALMEQPLPIQDCRNEHYGYCRCCYIPVVE